MRILGVIPARGGSTRIKRKNLQVVGGMTLVERAITQARFAELLDGFVVSTDDPEILVLATKKGAKTVARLCGSDGPMVDVLTDAMEQTADWYGTDGFDAVVTIQPTSPLRTSEDIDACVELWLGYAGEPHGVCVVSINTENDQRNGAVYVTPVKLIRKGVVFRGPPEDAEYIMPASRSLDINTPEDLEEARRILGP